MKTAKQNNRRRRRMGPELLLFPILALLLAAAIFFIGRFADDETKIRLDAPVYQFFMDDRAEYAAGTDLVPLEGGQIAFDEKGEKSSGDVSPIYFADEKAILLPVDMSWMDPLTGREWKVPALSRLEMDETGVVWCRDGEKECRMEGGFLSSGKGLCVLLEKCDLILNGLAEETSAFSFYSTVGGMVRYYDYESDMLTTKERVEQNTLARFPGGYGADLSIGIYTAVNGSQRLLVAGPRDLKTIWER